MGIGSSTHSSSNTSAVSSKSKHSSKATTLHKNENEVVQLMMPLYYSTTTTSAHERDLALNGWNLIIFDKSPEFLARKGQPDFQYLSCVTFFYDTFYTRLFEIHPMCKQLFKNGMRSQGTFLVKLITLALSELEDPIKFNNILKKLAETHYERGVKAFECKIL